MSRNSINRAADERGIAHSTASLIYECCETLEEFITALDDYAAGRGFVLCY